MHDNGISATMGYFLLLARLVVGILFDVRFVVVLVLVLVLMDWVVWVGLCLCLGLGLAGFCYWMLAIYFSCCF